MAQRRGWGAWLLLPLTGIYGILGALRRWMYRTGIKTSRKLPVPVVVVGNVVVGGAGKTPTTMALVQHLQTTGWHPGVISRGHGRVFKGSLAVTRETPATDCGDEPKLIAMATGAPVHVSKDRVVAGHELLSLHPHTDILVCDDGLQHLALGRDVEVVVFDDRGLGNGWQLPAGLLREPWPRVGVAPNPALILQQYRADGQAREIPVPSGGQAFRARRRLARRAMDLEGRVVELQALKNNALIAVAGIARPDVFFDMLRDLGLNLSRQIALPDHAGPLDYLAVIRQGNHAFICTEKDAVKLSAARLPPGVQVWSVALQLDIDAEFFVALEAQLLPRARRG